ncbi:unnamed protein product [Phyllotreta striolata]|uniref:Clarin-3 n=1 Tax=Phyllotreta striolata TaxID=444603 RepID=A0A9N9XJV8_PHYSR|nr:unnamed protein product [Phyllotreta striolata]
MATVKRMFVFVTCILSSLGVLMSLVSIITKEWVHSDKIEFAETLQRVKYGLFDGTFTKTYTLATEPLTMTCWAKKNICAYLSEPTSDQRQEVLAQIYDQLSKTNQVSNFINCGVWVTTILFLVLSMLLGTISAALAFYNTVTNPTQVYLSVYSLYVYNATALFTLMISMLSWGVLYHKTIYHNVAIESTLTNQMTSDKTAVLGYSYWLNLVPVVLYIVSICVLYLRQYLISRDPSEKIVVRNEDGAIIIY